MSSKRVALVTLGCKLNFAESSSIAQEFVEHGFTEVPGHKAADVYVVNTCTVTEHSDKKCRNLIRKVHRLNPSAPIIVTGCYAQLKAHDVAGIEGVSIVLGQHGKSRVFETALSLLEKAGSETDVPEKSQEKILETDAAEKTQKKIQETDAPEKHHDADETKVDCENIFGSDEIYAACSYGERTRSFLKVQDGCDYFCTYCTIPFARGHSRSVPAEKIIGQAESLAAKGIKEIVLTGVNIGDYGRRGGDCTFKELLERLDKVRGIERYRISSIEPNLLTEDIIDWIAGGTKFQPHFHIPLQSGSDSVLRMMKRKYDTGIFKDKIAYIRNRMGDVFFGIDVIVGFPGETDGQFEETYRFLAEEVRPAFIHVFPYSRRAGTIADRLPGQVKESVKTERVGRLEELCRRLHAEYTERFRGTKQEVLFESTVKGGRIAGYTGNYIRVEHPYDKELIGKIVTVEI